MRTTFPRFHDSSFAITGHVRGRKRYDAGHSQEKGDEKILAPKLRRRTTQERPADSARFETSRREKPASSSRLLSHPSSSPPYSQIALSLSYILVMLSFVSATKWQASLPRDRRNPLPSFRNDDIKRVLMSVQLWRPAPIKAHRSSTLFSLILFSPPPRFLHSKRLASHE